MSLLERDDFPFEFLSKLAERESWRKEIHRPIYHVHKWWAKRLGSVFRGIILGAVCDSDLESEYYKVHGDREFVVFDPFMGSGTTIGESHKLGLTAVGRDINPVAVRAVKVALGRLDDRELLDAFNELETTVARELLELYTSRDSRGRLCSVLYYFWVMTAACTSCGKPQDLFSSYIFARNAYPSRKPEVQLTCRSCGFVFRAENSKSEARCPSCNCAFDPGCGPVTGARCSCKDCGSTFKIIEALGGRKPDYRMYAKLVLTVDGKKEYLRAETDDLEMFRKCRADLKDALDQGQLQVPNLELSCGHNTDQAIRYGFRSWADFFNDRQLLGLAKLRQAIMRLPNDHIREAFLVLFSGVLEFNNMFASYKGEGTGAVRHMFSHHVLKPERSPIEANIWGTPKSSGAFSGLFQSRLLRAARYQREPFEIRGRNDAGTVSSRPLTGAVESRVPPDGRYTPRGIYLSAGDSAESCLASASVDAVITDPPFFDNVHYSELADFFQAWQVIGSEPQSSRDPREVQDTEASAFSKKLGDVFRECHRVLKEEGLLAFTYHHSRQDGWKAIAEAILSAGFLVVNAHPVKAEMSVAVPKQQASSPIQLDVIVVCKKATTGLRPSPVCEALAAARSKVERMRAAGFQLSENDCKVILNGCLLTAISAPGDWDEVVSSASDWESPAPQQTARPLVQDLQPTLL